jgi:hypothetical protein
VPQLLSRLIYCQIGTAPPSSSFAADVGWAAQWMLGICTFKRIALDWFSMEVAQRCEIIHFPRRCERKALSGFTLMIIRSESRFLRTLVGLAQGV